MRKNYKDYREWMGVKARVNNHGLVRTFKEGEIWWAAVGENVGTEIDGKSFRYSRPVIIFKKHSKLCFTAIPLSSQLHTGSWYCRFDFRGRAQNAVLVQAKAMDVTRLYEKIGELSRGDYRRIRDAFFKIM